MLIYGITVLMIAALGFVLYRTIRRGAEYRLVENIVLLAIVFVAASALGDAAEWFRWARYVYTALGAAYLVYGAYAKYRGGTDGYGQ